MHTIRRCLRCLHDGSLALPAQKVSVYDASVTSLSMETLFARPRLILDVLGFRRLNAAGLSPAATSKVRSSEDCIPRYLATTASARYQRTTNARKDKFAVGRSGVPVHYIYFGAGLRAVSRDTSSVFHEAIRNDTCVSLHERYSCIATPLQHLGPPLPPPPPPRHGMSVFLKPGIADRMPFSSCSQQGA